MTDLELLSELFSSKVRAAVLAYALPRPHLGFSLTDLSRRLGLPISSLQHECYKLERIGVLTGRRAGNARLYRAAASCPLAAELTALVAAVVGPEARLRAAVDGVVGLEAAFVTGVTPRPPSPLNPTGAGPTRLVLIGEVPFDALEATLGRVEVALPADARDVGLAFFRPADWRSHLARGDGYALALVAAPRLWLLGDERAQTAARAARESVTA